jgi:hypothetical protein
MSGRLEEIDEPRAVTNGAVERDNISKLIGIEVLEQATICLERWFKRIHLALIAYQPGQKQRVNADIGADLDNRVIAPRFQPLKYLLLILECAADVRTELYFIHVRPEPDALLLRDGDISRTQPDFGPVNGSYAVGNVLLPGPIRKRFDEQAQEVQV